MKKLIASLLILAVTPVVWADASDCNFISNSDGRNYCIAVAKRDRSYCGFISDSNRRNMCVAVASNDSSYCNFITNNDQRNQCRGQVGN